MKFHPGENKKNGGTVFAVADTARAEVANFPGSVDTSLPIYLQTRRAVTLSDICTIVVRVSSMFRISPGPTPDDQALLSDLYKKH
jgi:hypothetical protein